MKEIEDASVVDGEVDAAGNLILTKHDGNEINAGSVIGPPGPQGPQGLVGIPGEIKLWSGDTLPASTYGKWVWADGAPYPIAAHPLAAAAISPLWNTFGTPPAQAPPAGNFRVPDLRGLVPGGLDQMPGGTRANRIPRANAIIIAKILGEEKHILVQAEMAKHNHGRNVAGGPSEGGVVSVGGGISGSAVQGGGHGHQVSIGSSAGGYGMQQGSNYYAGSVLLKGTQGNVFGTQGDGAHQHSLSGNFAGQGVLDEKGGDIAHENLQPTVFVPYIVCLDG
jgi:microcystin-dependent protein